MFRRDRILELILRCALAVIAVAFLTSCNWQPRASVPPSEVSRQYASGGTVRIDLSRGNVELVGTSRNSVVAKCVESCEAVLRISSDSDARIWTDRPAGRTFGPGPKYVIEVPEVSDLVVHVAAGNLTLNGVKGSKDISLNAGNATLAIGRADDYGRVDLRVSAGTLAAGPWSAYSAGLVQNVTRTGQGKYSLHAVVNAGNLVINGEKTLDNENDERKSPLKHDSLL